MEMVGKTPGVRHKHHNLICQQIGLYAGNTVTLNAFHIVQFRQQIQERLTRMQSKSPRVHAGKHHLFGARSGYLPNGRHRIGNGGAPRPPPCEGDGTIGAEIVAAVLYFEEYARPVAVRIRKLERFRLLRQWQSRQCSLVNNIKELVFSVVAQNQTHPGNIPHLGSGVLCKTSDYSHHGRWVLPHRLTNSVATFLLGHRCHRAGVYHIDISRFVESHHIVTRLDKPTHQMRRLCEIELTT